MGLVQSQSTPTLADKCVAVAEIQLLFPLDISGARFITLLAAKNYRGNLRALKWSAESRFIELLKKDGLVSVLVLMGNYSIAPHLL